MPTEEEDRQLLLDAAGRLLGTGQGELAIVLVRGQVQIVQPLLGVAIPGQVPEGMSAYDGAIMQAIADRPASFQSSQQLARRAGHRHNSYFRERLALLVERGFIRQTRRGYTQPVP